MPRKVSGSSKSAAAASAEVMPGTISKETPASLRSGHFLAGATEDQRITGFEPDHALALAAEPDQQVVDIVLALGMTALALADRDSLGVATAERHHGFGYQRVIDYRIGFHHRALGPERQQVLGTRAGTDQPDVSGHGLAAAQHTGGGAAGERDLVVRDMGGDIGLEEPAPEHPARHAARQEPVDGHPVVLGEPGQRAQRRREHLVDTGADHLRQYGPGAFGADGNGHGRTVDQRGGEEIAEFRLVDRIGGDFSLARISHDHPVHRRIACGGKHQCRAIDLGRGIGCDHRLDTDTAQAVDELGFGGIGIDRDFGRGVGDQARLGRSLRAIAEDRHLSCIHPHEGGECGQLRRLRCHVDQTPELTPFSGI
jgi:hypothetical protein